MLNFFTGYLLIGFLISILAVYLWRKLNEPDLSGKALIVGAIEVIIIWTFTWPICVYMLAAHHINKLREKIRGRF